MLLAGMHLSFWEGEMIEKVEALSKELMQQYNMKKQGAGN